MPEEVASQTTFRLGPITRQMDYLFFRTPSEWSTRQMRIGRRYGSDHHPLLGWVHFGVAPVGVAVADIP